jgi:hypothetical protein
MRYKSSLHRGAFGLTQRGANPLCKPALRSGRTLASAAITTPKPGVGETTPAVIDEYGRANPLHGRRHGSPGGGRRHHRFDRARSFALTLAGAPLALIAQKRFASGLPKDGDTP